MKVITLGTCPCQMQEPFLRVSLVRARCSPSFPPTTAHACLKVRHLFTEGLWCTPGFTWVLFSASITDHHNNTLDDENDIKPKRVYFLGIKQLRKMNIIGVLHHFRRPHWSSGNVTGLSSGRFESRRDLDRSEDGQLLSIGVSVANVIRTPCYLLHASNHYIHVHMYAYWEVRQLLAEGRWYPPGPPVSSGSLLV